MKKRLLSVVVGAALVLGATALPAQVASATPLGKLTVQLVDLKGKAIHLGGVQLALTNGGAETDWTTNSKGLADFHSVGAAHYYTVKTVSATKYLPAKKIHITVTAGHTTHVHLTLTAGAVVSGTVQNTEGQHPTGITVQLVNTKTQKITASVLTSATGTYHATALPTGKYYVYFNYASTTTDEFSKLGTRRIGPVSVTQQTTTHAAVGKSHADATLTTLYELSGTTTITGLESVTAWSTTSSRSYEFDFRPVTTGTSRSFELYLPAGSYRVSADTDADPTTHYWYVSDWAAASASQSDAFTVTLTDSDDTIVIHPAQG